MTAPNSRFSFDLQRVLALREQREQAIAARLGVANDAAHEARNAMAALAAVRKASSADLVRAHGQPSSVGQLHQNERVLESLDQHIKAASEIVEATSAEVAKAQSDLNTAMQQRRVISRLRERREEEWRVANTRSERTAMDALAIQRHGRQTPDQPMDGVK
ncbi:MAG: flagellar export protein FliJ [Gemmatimonadaceae bacterium]